MYYCTYIIMATVVAAVTIHYSMFCLLLFILLRFLLTPFVCVSG